MLNSYTLTPRLKVAFSLFFLFAVTILPFISTGQSYCSPTWEYNSDGNQITQVTFGSISNTSPFTSGSTPSYEDFTAQSTTVSAGSSYPISVKGPSSTFPSDVVVFIDFNQNGSFDDAGESFFIGRLASANPANAFTITEDILIPSNAVSGTTRMRVLKNTSIAAYQDPNAPSSITGACDFYRAGQAEDYTIEIEGTEEPEETYCNVSVEYNVEPITLVNFSNLNNPTSSEVNATPAYEDFTAMVANVEVGETYTMTVKGNTVGNFEHDIRIFIDWNQDYVFDMATEFYTLSLLPSTGDDQMEATIDITIPADALTGNTRMRIIKDNWNVYEAGEFDACTGAYYGQIEDYTVNVSTGTEPETDYCTPDFFFPASNANVKLNKVFLAGETIIWNVNPVSYNETGYADYTSLQSADLFSGNNYDLVFNTDWDEPHWINVRAWIDFNQNYQFDNEEEIGYINSGMNQSGEGTFNFTVPGNTPVGTYRLRIMMQFPNSTPTDLNSCGTSNSYGIAIDYNVQVVEENTGVTSVEVTTQNNVPAEITVENGTLQLNATVLPAEMNQDVIWTIQSGNAFVSVDANGLVSAIANGTAIVRATSVEDNTKYDEIEITVHYTSAVVVESVIVSVQNNTQPVITIPNGTLQLIAAITPSTVSQAVTWSVQSGTAVVSVNPNGLVTALANGTAIVRATSVADTTKYDEIEITVNISFLGLESLENQLSVYPNPVAETLNISLNKQYHSTTVTVIDATGRILLEADHSSTDSILIDVSSFTSGIYQLIIRTDEYRVTKKIYKQ